MGGDRSRPPRDAVHVVAGVLSDARGRILLARRTAGRDLAGAWEFPGGKVEAGESPLAALDREWQEELGVRVLAASPLVSVPQAYPGKRIVLDVYRITSAQGTPRGRERQALAWAPADRLHGYPMPPADRPVVAVLNDPDRYLVTPVPGTEPGAFLARIERALLAGVRRLQLRAPGLPMSQLRPLAIAAQALCRQAGGQLYVNGEPELAAELGCGLHLRASQLMQARQRPLPEGQPLAASCHDAEQLRRAEDLGADFAVLGPVAATPSHPGQPALGWSAFAALREQVSLPIYAIGGMRAGDISLARRHGGQGIAAIRGLWPGTGGRAPKAPVA